MVSSHTKDLSVIAPVNGVVQEQVSKLAIKLHVSISTLFLCLILPAFAVFVAFIYKTNLGIYKENAAALITNHNTQMTDKLLALLDPIGDSLLTIAKQVRDDPRLFDTDNVNDTLLLHLENNPNLVSIFVASDKGNFRQVQRMREGMIVANRVPSPDAVFNFWSVDRSGMPADASKTGKPVESVFKFYKTRDAAPIETFAVPNNYDPRGRPFYKSLLSTVEKIPQEKRNRFLLLDEPYVSGSTSQATMTVSTPIFKDNVFKGMVGESFELNSIAKFLKSIQISKNSESYIIDVDGNIVVSTAADNGYTIIKLGLKKQNVRESSGKAVKQAYERYLSTQDRAFEFKNELTGETYLARFTAFPNNFNKNWEVLTLAPVSDFLVGLNAINSRLIVYGGATCIFLVLLTFILSRAISRPIETLTEEIRDLLEFNRPRKVIKSRILEITILYNTVNKLRNTLKAFTSYVPRDLVNDLLKNGNDIELGGESRYLTIFFTDLQGFSSISEVTPSRELVRLVSEYLSLVTYAVREESGTVDKFIGDSVMAFWGAPLLDQNHAYHACRAAVKSQRRMVELNRKLVDEGLPPLTVRIGIHSDAVLVGNIGSAERMSYTVMGDGVNVAARLEGINKEFATSICISHATYKEAGERLWTRPIDVITVKGRKGEIPIYEVVAICGDEPEISATENDVQLCKLTREAFTLYTAAKYKEAGDLYKKIIETYDDGLSNIMMERCRERMAT